MGMGGGGGGASYLYFRGSCLRMSSTDEIAYSPVSSVSTMTKLVVLPAPETAKKTCTDTTATLCHSDFVTKLCA